MQGKSAYRSTQSIEQGIRQSLSDMESAGDEAQAAQAYRHLKSGIEDFLRRSAELREEYYKLRNTVTRQANEISELSIEAAIGEAAPSDPRQRHFTIHEPDTITVQNSPDFFFVKLSYGLLNIRHIVELDVQSKTLFTTTGTRNLHADDIRTLLFHLKMYRPT